MTDRELLEKIVTRLDKMDTRLEKMDKRLSDFISTTEINFERLFNENRLIQAKLDNVIAQVKLNDEDHRHFKIQTRDRLDRLEEEKV